MEEKEIEGLSQEEWCSYLEILSSVLREEDNSKSEEQNELPQY